MVSAAEAAIAGFQIYYIFALMIDLFAAYKLATDRRFGKWKRYILAVLIVPIPFVEGSTSDTWHTSTKDGSERK